MTMLRTQAELFLQIYDSTETTVVTTLPITNVIMTFAINEVPSCQLQVGLGFDVFQDDPTPVITNLTQFYLQQHAKAVVVGRLKGDRDVDTPWDESEQTFFEGKIQQVSRQITRGAAGMNITLRHWLGELAGTMLVPRYAYGLSGARPAYRDATSGGVFGSDPALRAMVGQLLDGKEIDNQELIQDVWGNGIKKLLAALITTPALIDTSSRLKCRTAVNVVKQSAVRALERIQGPSDPLGTPYRSGGVPLKLGDQDFPAIVTQKISGIICHAPLMHYVNADIWGTIVNKFANTFHCTLIPRVQDAIFAPCPISLRDPYGVEIKSSDLIQIDDMVPMKKPSKAIGVVTGQVGMFGSGGFSSDVDNVCFMPPNVRINDGIVQYIPPPAYLQNIGVPADVTDALNGNLTGGLGHIEPPPKARPANTDNRIRELFERYAKSHYYLRKLNHRTTKLVGKLRFDIAPGTTVRITSDQTDIRGLAENPPDYLAMVNRMTIVIDAQQKMASTSFLLNNLRTEEENTRDDISSTDHPLFDIPFVGAPLIDAYTDPQYATEST